jgi:SAM-dependent methyltransferase
VTTGPAATAALRRLADGDRAAALRAARAQRDDPLCAALADHLARPEGERVYDEADAFAAFISHGGNPGLYRRTVGALRAFHAGLRPATVLDVGCGDGRVTAGVLGPWTRSVDLVEPSRELLSRARAAVAGAARDTPLDVRPHALGVTSFMDGVGPATAWDLAQSTFALHAVPPGERRAALGALARRCTAIAVAEFDVPDLPERSDAHLAHLAERYALGIAEYPDHPEVVAGFLMPVLVGQVEPGRPRLTWEAPAAWWADALRDAGFAGVAVAPLADYWWAPAVLVTGSA